MEIMDNPYPETPGERDERIEEVRTLIRESGKFPVDLKDEIARRAEEFVGAHIEEAAPNMNFYGGQLGWTTWVIKNEHLDLVAALAPVASAIATYATTVGAANPGTLAVVSLFAAAAVARKLRAKIANLDSVDYALLMTLKQLGPATPQQLAEAMSGLSIYGPGVWSDQRVAEVLKKLKGVRLADGSIEALVAEAPDGIWGTNGV